jgi:hypothetical protein
VSVIVIVVITPRYQPRAQAWVSDSRAVIFFPARPTLGPSLGDSGRLEVGPSSLGSLPARRTAGGLPFCLFSRLRRVASPAAAPNCAPLPRRGAYV